MNALDTTFRAGNCDSGGRQSLSLHDKSAFAPT